MSLIKRNLSARGSGLASVSVVNGSATTQSRSTPLQHERLRHGTPSAGGPRKGSYLSRSRNSSFGSRHSMFRVR